MAASTEQQPAGSRSWPRDAGLAADGQPSPFVAGSRLSVNESWLLWLRWVAAVGQLITIGVTVLVFGVSLPLGPLFSIIAVTAVTNLFFAAWLRSQSHRLVQQRAHVVLHLLMVLDLFSLTGLLYFTGGPENPFTIFYFVNVALAAIVLPARWSWTLLSVAVVCLASLFVAHRPLAELDLQIYGTRVSLAQLGLGVALAGCAAVVTYFITRVTRELLQREWELRNAEQQRAHSERLEALATLAAGAGHELASPLSTIAVIAKDLTTHLEGTDVPQSVIEDVGLIRSELDSCRKILDGLASSAGQATGEVMKPVPVAALIEEVVSGIRRRSRIELNVDSDTAQLQLVVPFMGVAQAIRGVVRNGLDASEPVGTVSVDIVSSSSGVCFTIADQGLGMTRDVLRRASEPFFTTKEPGQGMGLGLFLTRNVIERLGGKFDISSTQGRGTTVNIQLPRAQGQPEPTSDPVRRPRPRTNQAI